MAARGQAMEYIVVLSVVIAIAVISVSLLDYSPTVAKGTSQLASNVYWQSAAKPIQVKEVAQTAENQFAFTLKNVETSPIRITGIYLGGNPVEVSEGSCSSPPSPSIYFDIGEEKKVAVCDGIGVEGKAGQVVATLLKFDYASDYGTSWSTEPKNLKIALAYDVHANQSGNQTGPSCEGGLFLPTESGEYFYRLLRANDAGQIEFRMETPNFQVMPLEYAYQPSPLPPVSLGQVSACQQMAFSWRHAWWGWWGPYAADESRCQFTTISPTHWKALCTNGIFPPPIEDYDWEWEIYKG
ncbi:MAG: hypothetical protein N3F07_04050 [Candidatus Micrarchaeota archaeon]|nr:hypothetical protein [Candidatus Micrarchaeota archaeon]